MTDCVVSKEIEGGGESEAWRTGECKSGKGRKKEKRRMRVGESKTQGKE